MVSRKLCDLLIVNIVYLDASSGDHLSRHKVDVRVVGRLQISDFIFKKLKKTSIK